MIRDTLSNLEQLLNEFGNISGLRINKSKTWIIPIGRRANPVWLRDKNMENYNVGTSFRYLGLIVSNECT